MFKWSQSEMAKVDGTRKIQTERYSRMHGLWRAGSTGISPGNKGKSGGMFKFSADAWAKYENVWAECGNQAPRQQKQQHNQPLQQEHSPSSPSSSSSCKVMIRYRSAAARNIRVALDAPLAANVVATTPPGGVASANWTDLALSPSTAAGGFELKGRSVYLMLDGECEIDFFWFQQA